MRVVGASMVVVRGICEDGLILTMLENGSSFGCELANQERLITSRDGRAPSWLSVWALALSLVNSVESGFISFTFINRSHYCFKLVQFGSL